MVSAWYMFRSDGGKQRGSSDGLLVLHAAKPMRATLTPVASLIEGPHITDYTTTITKHKQGQGQGQGQALGNDASCWVFLLSRSFCKQQRCMRMRSGAQQQQGLLVIYVLLGAMMLASTMVRNSSRDWRVYSAARLWGLFGPKTDLARGSYPR